MVIGPRIAQVLLLVGFLSATGLFASVGTTSASAADTAPVSSQTKGLCHGSKVTCSIQVEPGWVEGTLGEVAVTGRPRVQVGVRAFRVTVVAGRATALTPVGPVARITTNSKGFGMAGLRLPVVPAGQTGGPVLFAVEDSVGSDLPKILGTWSVLASRRPLLLGDGFATTKPVGTALRLKLAAVVPGTRFDVELQQGGKWRSIGRDPRRCPGNTTNCVVDYEIPRGLTAGDHAVRLVDRSSGTPAGDWQVRPAEVGVPLSTPAADPTSAMPAAGAKVFGSVSHTHGSTSNPVPRARAKTLDLPDVAASVAGASEVAGHSATPVRVAAGMLGLLAVVLSVVAATAGSRRRSSWGTRRAPTVGGKHV